MHSNRLAAGVMVGALALAGAATGQVNTSCYTMAGQLYCSSVGAGPGTTFGTGYGSQTVLLPSQAQQMAAEAQLATIRAQQAQAELDAYRVATAQAQREAQARIEAARAAAYAQRVAACVKSVRPDDSEAVGKCATSSLRID